MLLSKKTLLAALAAAILCSFLRSCIKPCESYSDNYVSVKVKPGQTLWEIAEHYIDKQDKYKLMDEFLSAIRQANPDRQYHIAGATVTIPLPKRISN